MGLKAEAEFSIVEGKTRRNLERKDEESSKETPWLSLHQWRQGVVFDGLREAPPH